VSRRGKHGFRCLAQVFGQLGADVGKRHGRRGILQFAELGDPVGRKQVAARGEDLPQFDKGRPQFFQRLAHPLRGLQAGQVFGAAQVQVQRGPCPFQRPGHAQPLHQIAKPVADEHRRNVVHPAQVAGGAEGFPEHQASLSVSFDPRRAAIPWSRPAARPASRAASWRRTSVPFLA
jgi:hypothetical protein